MAQIPTLHVIQRTRNSFKPMQVAAQLALECNVDNFNVRAGESRVPEFLDINPLGQLLFMVLEDGTSLGESNAIAWYLAEGSELMPNSALSRAQCIRWMNYEHVSNWLARVEVQPGYAPIDQLLTGQSQKLTA